MTTAEEILTKTEYVDNLNSSDLEVLWENLQEDPDFENLSQHEIISRARANLKNMLSVLDYVQIKGEEE
jgi:hypothetical protein